jgi:ubiquinone biosynthesis protein Coq4
MIKFGKALRGFGRLVWDPFDFAGAMVLFDAFESFGPVRDAYARMVSGLAPDERDHLRALTERPLDLAAMSGLPSNTLGYAYATFFDQDGLYVDAQVRAHPDLNDVFAREWLYNRFCRVHDFHHVLLGFKADIAGEMGLQAFNLSNFGEPFAALAMLSTPVTALRYGSPGYIAREVERGWKLGRELPNLFVAPFEDWYDHDMGAVRERLGVKAITTRSEP